MASQTLTIRRPDDWHVHLRDGEMLKAVAPFTARQFARAIVMPNLVPPISTVEAANAYRERIVAAAGPGFTPLMTCYLTDDANPDEIARGFEEGVWIAAKLYPAGATTNSASGVTDIRNIYPTLARMERIGMVLCVHGEVTDPRVDVFDREAVFIERVLSPLVKDFPELKIVFEHITTDEAVEFVKAIGERRGDDHAAASASSIATPCSPAASGRTPTACRSPSARSIAWPCARPRPRARPNSSSAPTARRMRARPRKAPAAAPASSTRLSRSKAT